MLLNDPIFKSIFTNAQVNGMVVMDDKGIVQEVNSAFTTSYGYSTDDLKGKHFRILYTEKDQVRQRPQIELNTTLRQGAGNDENYLVHKDGTPIWVSGESILVSTGDTRFIVKIVHNIHAQKQLERYLLSSSELLDGLFESVQSGLLLLDSQVRIIKTNAAFRKMFDCEAPIPEGSRIRDIGHPFWNEDEVKTDVRNTLINGERLNKQYIVGNDKQDFRQVHIATKLIVGDDTPEKKLLLVVKWA